MDGELVVKYMHGNAEKVKELSRFQQRGDYKYLAVPVAPGICPIAKLQVFIFTAPRDFFCCLRPSEAAPDVRRNKNEADRSRRN